ncbi:hypothetical protein [Streptomyces sp. SCL15-4]|uniref:hypothetical protein n=1 Tax=Streptomyces sp. SCL15-4 TaxID=2967221 RepID=UPI002966B7A0|nr:hypothetical protein [Streptomyces sp. SCL15-4]
MPHDQLDLDAIEARANAATPGPWRLVREQCDCSDGYCHHGEYVTGVVTPQLTELAVERIARTGGEPQDYDYHRSDVGDFTEADWELMVHAREDVDAMANEIRRLRADASEQQAEIAKLIRWHGEDETAMKKMRGAIERLRAELAEMTHLRDNALRALYRDDVNTDIDLEETIAAPFYGPGWDWDEADLQRVAREAAAAVRPAFGKLTQQRDKARQRAREYGELAARRESELIALRAELATARTAALTEGAAGIDHLRATMLAPPVADLYANGLSRAAGELRRLAAAVVAHVVADDSDDPEHVDDCPGCETAARRP